ncbi:hypothetical protein GCM10007913_26660 [Devosia yakushimensis]|uniref:Spore coat protein U domain-containing protein n=1 Tax=Devosia yakushimensis TaxID=470028 RepID=A0ABQ5UHT8_9HYPH|nr:hypothetical protein [Devosia yakushimensis]GLQ10734.1 hypothetical protein GCM10007913_26660 [Devosia yakushimensis]
MKSLPVLALLPLFLATTPQAFAQTGGEQCAAIAGDVERLACYDGVFRAATSSAAGISVVLESEQLIPARPSGRAPATITVACEAGLLSVAFYFAGNTMSALGNDAGLTLQYDLQAARSRTLPVNASNTAILINNSREAAAFLDGLAGATNLTARVTPANSRSLSVRFRIDSFAQQVAPVRAACD